MTKRGWIDGGLGVGGWGLGVGGWGLGGWADGMKLYLSENNVILTEGFDGIIPKEFFKKVELRSGDPYEPPFQHSAPQKTRAMDLDGNK